MKRLIFKNKCSQEVAILVNDIYKLDILPNNTEALDIDEFEKLEIKIRQKKDSLFFKKYRLTIETKYTLIENSNEISFDIKREIIRVTADSYYEKIILDNPYVTISNERNCICDLEKIKSIYKKRNAIYSFFISPFEHMTGLCIVLIVLSFILFYKIGWKVASVSFVLSYLFIFILDHIVGKCSDFLFKKSKFFVNDKSEFNTIIDDKYVNDFFNSTDRKAYMNDSNIEGL